MKKRISVLLAATLTAGLALSACGAPPSSAANAPQETATTEQIPVEPTATPAAATALAEDLQARAVEIQHDPDNYTDILRDVPYLDDDLDYHQVDLYGTTSEEVMPVVIEVHGGGFIGGNRENNAAHCIFFAERNYKVVATDYPRIPRDGNFIDAIQDLFVSYQWVADHADDYGFDMSNVILSGDSAGGYYVLLTCAIWNSPELQEYFGVTVPDFQFNGFVTTCPLADIRSMQADLELESGPNAHTAQTIGADLLLNEDLMSHLDFMQSVDPQAFSNIYMLTTPGDDVTGETVQTFDSYLTENGVPHTTISYEGVENELSHTFNISHPEYSESLVANQDMVDYCNSLLE